MLLLAAIAISWEDAGECELCWRLLTRIFHELPAATTDMAVFPGVLGCSFDRLRTGSPCDVPFRYASGPIPRYRGTSCQVAHPSSRSRDSNS